MTDVLVPDVMPVDAEGFAERIRVHQAKGVESLLAIGREFIAAKASLAHGEFGQVAELVGIAPRSVQRYMAVARNEALGKSAVTAHLPAKIMVLEVLAKIGDAELDGAVERGEVTPEMDLDAATELAARLVVPPAPKPVTAPMEFDEAPEIDEGAIRSAIERACRRTGDVGEVAKRAKALSKADGELEAAYKLVTTALWLDKQCDNRADIGDTAAAAARYQLNQLAAGEVEPEAAHAHVVDAIAEARAIAERMAAEAADGLDESDYADPIVDEGAAGFGDPTPSDSATPTDEERLADIVAVAARDQDGASTVAVLVIDMAITALGLIEGDGSRLLGEWRDLSAAEWLRWLVEDVHVTEAPERLAEVPVELLIAGKEAALERLTALAAGETMGEAAQVAVEQVMWPMTAAEAQAAYNDAVAEVAVEWRAPGRCPACGAMYDVRAQWVKDGEDVCHMCSAVGPISYEERRREWAESDDEDLRDRTDLMARSVWDVLCDTEDEYALCVLAEAARDELLVAYADMTSRAGDATPSVHHETADLLIEMRLASIDEHAEFVAATLAGRLVARDFGGVAMELGTPAAVGAVEAEAHGVPDGPVEDLDADEGSSAEPEPERPNLDDYPKPAKPVDRRPFLLGQAVQGLWVEARSAAAELAGPDGERCAEVIADGLVKFAAANPGELAGLREVAKVMRMAAQKFDLLTIGIEDPG